jgi:hypothetical protein
MARYRSFPVVLLLGALLVMACPVARVVGEDFRVDNAVYVADQKEPVTQSTTIFLGGTVYDCMKSPAETVIFDKAADRFVLLNLPQRTRTELSTSQLASFVDQLQVRAAKSKDPLVKFLAEPKFEERMDEASGELTVASPLVSYRLTLVAESNQAMVEQYHEFCDYYARLNALLVPGSRPPFGRLVVNAAVAQRQATASKVLLTVGAGKGSQQRTTIRSEHRIVRPLEPADLERVARVRESQASFKLVAFEQYRKTQLR